MNVITLRDYAKQNNISYEAVRKQLARYKNELGDHIIKDGRQQFLDDEAVAFLDGKRQKNPIAIIQQDKDERIDSLEKENKNLLQQLAIVQDALLKEKDKVQMLLEEQKEQVALLEAQNADLSAEKDRIDKEAREAIDEAQNAVNELSRVYEDEKKRHEDEEYLLKQRAEAAEKRNQELENRTFGDYLKSLFRKKHKE